MFLLATDGKGGDLERSLSLWGGLQLLMIKVIYSKKVMNTSRYSPTQVRFNATLI